MVSHTRRCELMAGGTGRVLVSKILHGSPAHVCGRIAVGDELVSIDGFEITPANMHLFAKRAAAGAKDSLIKLCISHPVTFDASVSKMHDVVLQRSEIFETPPVLYSDATNASISPTVSVLAPQAGLGVVITVSSLTHT